MTMSFPENPGPIGVFDSGYGGLTILHGIRQMLPQYDYLYTLEIMHEHLMVIVLLMSYISLHDRLL